MTHSEEVAEDGTYSVLRTVFGIDYEFSMERPEVCLLLSPTCLAVTNAE